VSKRLSFAQCHGLSVTRSKAAAGRQLKRHICSLLWGLTLDGRIAVAMLCLQSRDEPAPCAKPILIHTQSSDEGLRCLQRRDGTKICPFQGTEWRERREKQFFVHLCYPPLKIVSPGVITPKTPDSFLPYLQDFPPVP